MIAGNLSSSKELAQVMSQFPEHTFPSDIPEHNQTGYNFIGIRVKQGKGLSQTLQIHQFCKSSAAWAALADEYKNAQSLGNYSQIIMIHNPELTEKKESKPKKRVTTPVKKKISKLLEDGKSSDEIAQELGLSESQVTNSIK